MFVRGKSARSEPKNRPDQELRVTFRKCGNAPARLPAPAAYRIIAPSRPRSLAVTAAPLFPAKLARIAAARHTQS